MKESMIRIKEAEIYNIKNVEYGKMDEIEIPLLYYRSINFGGQKEEIYKGTKGSAICQAFRRVGQRID